MSQGVRDQTSFISREVSSSVSLASLQSADYGFSSLYNSSSLPSASIRPRNNNTSRSKLIFILGIVTIFIFSVGLGLGLFIFFRDFYNGDNADDNNDGSVSAGNDPITLLTVSPSLIPSLKPSISPSFNPSVIVPIAKTPYSLSYEPSMAPSNDRDPLFPSISPTFMPQLPSNNPSASFEPSTFIYPSKVPTQSPSIEASSISPSTSLFSQINEAILPLYNNPDLEESSPSPLLNSSSPQSKALTWMEHNDKYDYNTMSSSTSEYDDTIQRYVIIVIYFSMHGNTWDINNNWMSTSYTSHVCQWYGILCYNYPTNLIVNQLLLNDNNVHGFIPREIVLLNEIDHIDLGNNQIGGTIPSLIGSLQKLNDLRLYSNRIIGNIPPDIGKLSLRILYLDNNRISGTIPEEFYNAYSLEDVKLNTNLLQGTLSNKLCTLSNLERFWISDNQFIGKFPSITILMINLKYLYIDNNKFSGTFPMYLPEVMFELRDLRMSNNSFNGCIPKTTFKMKYLETLYLDYNKFECEIFPEIYNGPALVDLQMQYNNLFGKLPQVLDYVSKLQYLDISNNDLSDLPNDFVPLRYIKYLSLANNKIKSTIPPNLGLLADLEMLKLDHNYLSGMIPLELDSLKKLKLFFVEENNLIGTMPTAVCDIQYSNYAVITADCAGEYPLVNCNCCSNCEPFAS